MTKDRRENYHMPPEGKPRLLSWRDLAKTNRGQELINTLTAPFALQRVGIFEPQCVSLIQSLWLKMPLQPQLDRLMGLVISTQLLYETCINPPASLALARFTELKPGNPSHKEELSPIVINRPSIASVPGKIDLSSWDIFVLRHTKPLNHTLHFISAIMFFGGPIAAIILRNPYYLIPFFLSGFVGTFGHFISRDGGVSLKEATAQHTVPIFVLRMFYLIFTGRYGREIANAQKKLECGTEE